MKRILASLAAALLLALPAQAQDAESRVALIIGNGAYKDMPLKNPPNDARAISARLMQLGFDVTSVVDATREQMGRAVVEFGRKLKPSSVAVVFYAGHGIQARGRNYLIPVDAAIDGEGDLRFQALDVTGVLEEIEQARARVGFIILDACRNNPFERRFRGAQSAGLAAIDAARGMMIAYATAPGSVAADGDGDNGVYTAALLKALAQPGLKAEEVFKRVRIEVNGVTRNAQTPWESSSLTGDFVFHVTVNVNPLAAAPSGAAPAAAAAGADREALFWSSIKDSGNSGDLEDYLKRYPQGEFAGIARRRIEQLKTPRAAAVPPPAATQTPAPAPAAQPVVAGPPEKAPEKAYVVQSLPMFRDCPDCPEMVALPAGRFAMGSPEGEAGRDASEGPRHEVQIKPFALGKYEITRGQFAAFLRETGHEMARKGCNGFAAADNRWIRVPNADWTNPGFAQTDQHPVVCVNWDEARAYVAWLAKKTGKPYRLPSEAEWEYAARAGTTTPWYWGEAAAGVCGRANLADQALKRAQPQHNAHDCSDGADYTAPVGKYPANPFGLHDMVGNAMEWVEDCWNQTYGGAPADGGAWTAGPCDKRVYRGAGWNLFASAGRSAARRSALAPAHSPSAAHFSNVGFRVAR